MHELLQDSVQIICIGKRVLAFKSYRLEGEDSEIIGCDKGWLWSGEFQVGSWRSNKPQEVGGGEVCISGKGTVYAQQCT